jgi:hypothetical protein
MKFFSSLTDSQILRDAPTVLSFSVSTDGGYLYF